eukprot:gene15662-6948_t
MLGNKNAKQNDKGVEKRIWFPPCHTSRSQGSLPLYNGCPSSPLLAMIKNLDSQQFQKLGNKNAKQNEKRVEKRIWFPACHTSRSQGSLPLYNRCPSPPLLAMIKNLDSQKFQKLGNKNAKQNDKGVEKRIWFPACHTSRSQGSLPLYNRCPSPPLLAMIKNLDSQKFQKLGNKNAKQNDKGVEKRIWFPACHTSRSQGSLPLYNRCPSPPLLAMIKNLDSQKFQKLGNKNAKQNDKGVEKRIWFPACHTSRSQGSLPLYNRCPSPPLLAMIKNLDSQKFQKLGNKNAKQNDKGVEKRIWFPACHTSRSQGSLPLYNRCPSPPLLAMIKNLDSQQFQKLGNKNAKQNDKGVEKRIWTTSELKIGYNWGVSLISKTYRFSGRALDCRVSQWTSWTACSNDCGLGVMKRKRFRIQAPRNGGKACPPLWQKRGCALYQCKRRAQTAFVLPADPYRRVPLGSYGFEDILPAPKKNQQVKVKVDNYCINYKLMVKRSQCRFTWADKLVTKIPICVECQPRVMGSTGHCRGEGAPGVRSHWKAFMIPRCHGEWIRLGPAIPHLKDVLSHQVVWLTVQNLESIKLLERYRTTSKRPTGNETASDIEMASVIEAAS